MAVSATTHFVLPITVGDPIRSHVGSLLRLLESRGGEATILLRTRGDSVSLESALRQLTLALGPMRDRVRVLIRRGALAQEVLAVVADSPSASVLIPDDRCFEFAMVELPCASERLHDEVFVSLV